MKPTRFFALALVMCVLGTGLAPRSAEPDTVLFVDKDLAQCPHAQFQSIQAAVDAAPPGATIMVCPDLYTESVSVSKTLTLRKHGGGGSGVSNRHQCFDPAAPAPDPTREAIVEGADFSFSLDAHGIVLDGLVIQGATVGVVTSDAFAGYVIRNNLIQDNLAFGIDFHASGAAPSIVAHNCMRFNDVGLASEQGNLSNARIEHNLGFANRAGLDVSGAGSRDAVAVEHNILHQVGGGIIISNSTGSRIAHNAIDAFGASIIAGGGNIGLEIENNVMDGGRRGIIFCRPCTLPEVAAPSVDLEVRHNQISNKVFSGIHAFPGDSLVQSRIAYNHASGNVQDGIRIDLGGNTGNVIEHNRLSGNVEHDCHDDTSGPGTAGTANTWRRNSGETENRPRLCVGTGD